MAATIITPIGILCFADGLQKAKPPAEGAKPRFSALFLFDSRAVASAAYANLRRGVQEVALEKWGQKAADPAFMRALRLPFRPASEKQYTGFDQGEIYIGPWSETKPGIVDVQGNEILVPEDVWSGQLARATVRPFAYDTSGNKGVSLALEHVQIVKADMPRLDGRQAATAAFKNADEAELKQLGIDPAAMASGPGGAW